MSHSKPTKERANILERVNLALNELDALKKLTGQYYNSLFDELRTPNRLDRVNDQKESEEKAIIARQKEEIAQLTSQLSKTEGTALPNNPQTAFIAQQIEFTKQQVQFTAQQAQLEEKERETQIMKMKIDALESQLNFKTTGILMTPVVYQTLSERANRCDVAEVAFESLKREKHICYDSRSDDVPRAHYDDLNKKYSEVISQLLDLQNEHEQEKTNNSELRTQLKELTRENAKNIMIILDSDYYGLQKKFEQVKEEHAKKVQELEQTIQEFKKRDLATEIPEGFVSPQRYSELERTFNAVKDLHHQKLKTWYDERDGLWIRITDLKKRLNEETALVIDLTKQLEGVNDRTKMRDAFEKTVDTENFAVDLTKTAVQVALSYEKTIKSLQEQIAQHIVEKENLANELNRFDSTISSHEATIKKNLQEQLAEKDNYIIKAAAIRDQLQTKNDELTQTTKDKKETTSQDNVYKKHQLEELAKLLKQSEEENAKCKKQITEIRAAIGFTN